MGLMSKKVRQAKTLLRSGRLDDHWIFLLLERLSIEGLLNRSQVLQKEWARVQKIFSP